MYALLKKLLMQKAGLGSALAQRIFRGPGRTACCTILTGFYFDMCQSTCVGETASWALLCAVPRRCSNKKLHVSTRRALFDKWVWPASHHAPAMMASAACVDAVWRRLLWRKQITYFVSENLAQQRHGGNTAASYAKQQDCFHPRLLQSHARGSGCCVHHPGGLAQARADHVVRLGEPVIKCLGAGAAAAAEERRRWLCR